MTVSSFLQYARAELSQVPHPYRDDASEAFADVPLLVRVVDYVLLNATDRYEALAETFYTALHGYLTAPRHRKALLAAAIGRMAMSFEGFLRTIVVLWPDLDQEMLDAEDHARGHLSDNGYVYDFSRLLFGIELRLGAGETGWRGEAATAAALRECNECQQRAKHEAPIYSLAHLEELARWVLCSYLFAARWLVNNTDVAINVASRLAAASGDAVCHWPSLLVAQLDEVRFGTEDSDLAEVHDELRQTAADLQQRAADILESGVNEDSEELKALRNDCEALAFSYEMLITESNMRDWGREREADMYM